jgi:hypothetical protein
MAISGGVPSLETLAWLSCTADCRRLRVRSTPCRDCLASTRRVVIRLALCGAVDFKAARQILDQAPRGPADAPA